jgi:hypothetical protein
MKYIHRLFGEENMKIISEDNVQLCVIYLYERRSG